jgi:hypothetical protein
MGMSRYGKKMRRWKPQLAVTLIFSLMAVILRPGAETFAEIIETNCWSRIYGCSLSTGSDLVLTEDEEEEWKEGFATESDVEQELLLLATSSNMRKYAATAAKDSADLWKTWSGETDWEGDGTEDSPYRIQNVSELMGLSAETTAGTDFKDVWFELTTDLDISIYGAYWNPIGWYQNQEEMENNIGHPFRGNFNGNNHKISGLRMVNTGYLMKNAGLFGIVEDGSIRNLEVKATELTADENVGILAGKITGNAVIYGVTVSGYISSNGNAGGVAGWIEGDEDKITIENCRADQIAIDTSDEDGFSGGIGGKVKNAFLVDNTVVTQDGTGNRIQGYGYVGGIAGCMENTDIYSSYVDGTIGGHHSLAVGGIVGKYISGSLILARMAGDIGNTNMGQSRREGVFVGTRDWGDFFTYGTDSNNTLSYLFTTVTNSKNAVVGSTIDGDNDFKKSAHIGYWLDNERKYVIREGEQQYGCGDRYFYEELEDGVRYIITQKLSQDMTADDYADGLSFHVDHFAPGYMGEPVRGYLIYVPVITAVNANGTMDKDVAVLSALPAVNSTYYRTIDKDHPAAVMPGAAVTVLTAPKDTVDSRYQMIVAAQETGGVEPPTYTDVEGKEHKMTYQSSGTYSFIMPECDTELKAQYQKVTTRLDIDPSQITVQIIQTRSSDRKNPKTITEVRNEQGILIARYINDELDSSVEVQPIAIHIEHNETGSAVDKTVIWSVDDTDLILNQSETGYTEKDGRFLPNMNSSFIQEILQKKMKEQADDQYQNPIDDTVYSRTAVMTAMTNPDTSSDLLPVYANCRITVTYQIVDKTTLRVEQLSLNRNQLVFTVTRKRSGYRYQPSDTISCTAPVVLSASLYPIQPFFKSVSWSDTENGKIVKLKAGGSYMQDCTVSVNYDPEGKENPAWIQNLINTDNALWEEDKSRKMDSSGSHTEIIRAVSEDQTHGIIRVECEVTVNFVTEDETTLYRVSSSGSAGGGGGSGSSSTGITASTMQTKFANGLPDYVIKGGTWTQNGSGQWLYVNDHTYTSEWAAIQNPYANLTSGQSAFEWFRFDKDSFMVTGWYQDTDGNLYYLNPVSDGTLGGMVTGWRWINGKCYYFQEKSDGTKGALVKDTVTPDGYIVNQLGEWMIDGVVQKKE